jgi:hypothetical protein
MAGRFAVVNPLGNVSVKEMLDNTWLGFGLVIVNTNTLVPPARMGFVVNNLEMIGG